jgi:hypothetical protein
VFHCASLSCRCATASHGRSTNETTYSSMGIGMLGWSLISAVGGVALAVYGYTL